MPRVKEEAYQLDCKRLQSWSPAGKWRKPESCHRDRSKASRSEASRFMAFLGVISRVKGTERNASQHW